MEESHDPTPDLWRRAHGVLAAGLWSLSQGEFRYPEGIFPLLADRGIGCRIIDTSGRAYIDWMMAWGPVVLGYRHPEVDEAIRRQLDRGTLFSLLHGVEIEVAEKIRDMVPCAERVAFGKNGSDALGIAVRVARALTGREGILVHGYHGYWDWYMAGVPGCQGIPWGLRTLVRSFPYNDLEHLEEAFRRHGDKIAAVVMEPANTELPHPGYLEGVRRLTQRYRALLVFDEVITGFRLARGGAQEYFGVVPDLACLGKAMSSGMPLSALVGAADAMERVEAVGYGATFRGETLSLAAARAALGVIEREPVTERLWEIGDVVRKRFRGAACAAGLDADLHGPSPRMTFSFAPAGGISPLGLQTLFVQECVRRGILTNGNLLPSYAHDDEAVEESCHAFEESIQVVARAASEGNLDRYLRIPVLALFHQDRSITSAPGGSDS